MIRTKHQCQREGIYWKFQFMNFDNRWIFKDLLKYILKLFDL